MDDEIIYHDILNEYLIDFGFIYFNAGDSGGDRQKISVVLFW